MTVKVWRQQQSRTVACRRRAIPILATTMLMSIIALSLAFPVQSFTSHLPVSPNGGVDVASRRMGPTLSESKFDGDNPGSEEEEGRGDEFAVVSSSRIPSRRELFEKVLRSTSAALLAAGAAASVNDPAFAADAGGNDGEATIWLTGKAPKVPGQKPKDKGDVKGTRRDPNFLRSISDCKNQCENTVGPDGLARTKEECLSECQDICCTTYEQCTFGIVQRI